MTEKELNKILQQFPWLWAIQRIWDPNFTEVKIRFATPQLFIKNNLCSSNVEIWIRESILNYQKVRKANAAEKMSEIHIFWRLANYYSVFSFFKIFNLAVLARPFLSD